MDAERIDDEADQAELTTRDACKALLELIESYGSATLPGSLLLERCGRSAVETFISLGLLGAASRAARHPCGDDRHGCSRHITEDGTDTELPLVAHCNRMPAKCASVHLSEDDCVEHAVILRGLELALLSLFHVTPTLSRREPPLEKVGVQRGRARDRDVFVAWQPIEPAFSLALRLRESVDRPALVLVPTARGVSPDLWRRHGAKSRIEIRALDTALDLKDGELVLSDMRRDGRRPPRRAITHGRPLLLPTISAWRQLSIYRNGESPDTIVVRVGSSEVTASHIDLGMASLKTRRPNAPWESLLLVCDFYGWYRERGTPAQIKMRLSRLRRALREIFGIAADPFAPYSSRAGWRARFHAAPVRILRPLA